MFLSQLGFLHVKPDTNCLFRVFRYVDAVPNGAIFVVMCLIVRCVMASGDCAFRTSRLAILANEFPNKVSTVYVCNNFIFFQILVLKCIMK